MVSGGGGDFSSVGGLRYRYVGGIPSDIPSGSSSRLLLWL